MTTYNAQSGYFSGYASVYGITDSQKDIIIKGAFAETIRSRLADIKVLWQHDFSQPIGVLSQIRENDYGLYVEGRILSDVRQGQEALALMKAGAINGLSIGFRPKDYTIDAKTGKRIIKSVELFEVSIVTFPSNKAAVVQSVKRSREPFFAPLTSSLNRAIFALNH